MFMEWALTSGEMSEGQTDTISEIKKKNKLQKLKSKQNYTEFFGFMIYKIKIKTWE